MHACIHTMCCHQLPALDKVLLLLPRHPHLQPFHVVAAATTAVAAPAALGYLRKNAEDSRCSSSCDKVPAPSTAAALKLLAQLPL